MVESKLRALGEEVSPRQRPIPVRTTLVICIANLCEVTLSRILEKYSGGPVQLGSSHWGCWVSSGYVVEMLTQYGALNVAIPLAASVQLLSMLLTQKTLRK